MNREGGQLLGRIEVESRICWGLRTIGLSSTAIFFGARFFKNRNRDGDCTVFFLWVFWWFLPHQTHEFLVGRHLLTLKNWHCVRGGPVENVAHWLTILCDFTTEYASIHFEKWKIVLAFSNKQNPIWNIEQKRSQLPVRYICENNVVIINTSTKY